MSTRLLSISDIYNIPVYYISSKKRENLENHFLNRGFVNIHHFQAVDGRKYDPRDLRERSLITIRAYNDLIEGREQHSGLSSLGAVGCTMSHAGVWKTCVDLSLPYIIVAEDDAYLYEWTREDVKGIERTLLKKNGVFVTSHFFRGKRLFNGSQFYFITNGACREALKGVYPIDVQTDHYLSHLHQLGRIDITAKRISTQKRKFLQSSVQDLCIKCVIPRKLVFYLSMIVVIIGLVYSVRMYYLRGCKRV